METHVHTTPTVQSAAKSSVVFAGGASVYHFCHGQSTCGTLAVVALVGGDDITGGSSGPY